MGAADQFPIRAIELSGAVDPDGRRHVEYLCVVAHEFAWTICEGEISSIS